MEVQDSDFRDPCRICIIKPCCSTHCDAFYRFFVEGIFESSELEFSKEIQNDLLSCRGISVEVNYNGQEKKKRKIK